MDISNKNCLIFKIRYNQVGNNFIIQIYNPQADTCKAQNNKTTIRERNIYLYDKKPNIVPNSQSAIQFLRNCGISELSDYYNNKTVDRNHQNQITATIFYCISPFNPKTIARKQNFLINPTNSIDGILKSFGGTFFKFKSNETLSIDEYPFHIFYLLGFHLFFYSILHSDKFDQMSTIELDGTFEALDPYVLCNSSAYLQKYWYTNSNISFIV
ncbi:hypothetical protein M9Y10_027563, partial [Tritrichomonas musculus]